MTNNQPNIFLGYICLTLALIFLVGVSCGYYLGAKEASERIAAVAK